MPVGYIIAFALGILVSWYVFKAVKYSFGNFNNLMERLSYIIANFIRDVKKRK